MNSNILRQRLLGILTRQYIIGEDGGGKKIEWKRLVDRNNLIFNFEQRGEFSGVVFIKWKAWNFFELNIQEKRLLFTNLGLDKIQVKYL